MTEHAAAVEAAALRVLEAVADAAERTGVSWMIAGAMARRLVFEGIHFDFRGRYTEPAPQPLLTGTRALEIGKPSSEPPSGRNVNQPPGPAAQRDRDHL